MFEVITVGRMEEDKFRIPLFDGNNYDDWKFRMEVFLDEKEVLEHLRRPLMEWQTSYTVVDGDNKELKESKEKALLELQRADKRCKNFIIQRIHDSQLEHVKGKQTAYEVWTSLQKRFERKGVTSRMILNKKLHTLKYRPSIEAFSEYCLKFDKLVRELKTTGEQMDEEGIVIKFLLTMPEELEGVVSGLQTLGAGNLSLEFVRQRIEEEETARRERRGNKTRQDFQPVAFSGARCGARTDARPGSSRLLGPTNQKVNYPYKCHNCGIVGHKRYECWKPGGGMHGRGSASGRGSRGSGTSQRNAHLAKQEEKKEEVPVYSFLVSTGECCVAQDGMCKNEFWVLDSGATDHLVMADTPVVNRRKLSTPVSIGVAKSKVFLLAKEMGDVLAETQVSGELRKLEIKDVLLVENLKHNLLSVPRLESRGFKVEFENGKCTVLDDKRIVVVGNREGNLYKIGVNIQQHESQVNGCSIQSNGKLWHARLGHIGNQNLSKLSKVVNDIGMIEEEDKVCEICIEGKQTAGSHNHARERAKRPLERVHSDLCGPISPMTQDGKKYILTFIDDFTHFTVAFGLKSKDEVLHYIKLYEAMASSRFSERICCFRCDNGREFVNREVNAFFEEKGIKYELTIPRVPEQNGVAERMNRTILDKARCMMLGSKLNKTFWLEAVLTAVYLINRSPTTALPDGKLPAEIWYGKMPDLNKLRVFGCIAYAHKVKGERNGKFDSHSRKCIMLGYCDNGYRLWCLELNRIIVASSVKFDETKNQFDKGHWDHKWEDEKHVNLEGTLRDGDDVDSGEEQESFHGFEESSDEENEVRVRKAPGYLKDYVVSKLEKKTRCKGGKIQEGLEKPEVLVTLSPADNVNMALNAISFCEGVPQSIEELEDRGDRNCWLKAIDEEVKSLTESETWEEVRLPEGKKAINSRWVFTVKHDQDGNLERYKARLVIKGCAQVKGFDYSDTYAPVAKLATVRTLFCLANSHALYVHHLDVKNAFLHGVLKEEIFMYPPEGVQVKDGMVLRLKKTLYGLKQAPKEWNSRFDEYVKSLGFVQCQADKCVYMYNDSRCVVYLLLYVDDFLIASKSLDKIKELKGKFMSEFKMRDLKDVKYFLGIKVERIGQTMYLSQTSYLEKLLTKFKMEHCKPVQTPLELRPNQDVTKPSIISVKPYRELIGSLMYACLTTRPDISAAVNYYSQFQSNATEVQWVGLKRILRYLKGTLNWGLCFRGSSDVPLVGYVDADFANQADRKSVTGFLFEMYGDVIYWATRKQKTVALSTTESEFVALASATSELLWLMNLLKELGIESRKPVTIFEDNQSCIYALGNWEPKRLKHIDVKYNFVKDLCHHNVISVKYVTSEDQKADVLTKGLAIDPFVRHRRNLGMSVVNRCIQ